MKEHTTSITVRFSEVDASGIVYFANFYVWADSVAFNDYFVSLGLPYTEIRKRQIDLVIGESSCRFRAPAQLDDLVEIHTSIKELKDRTVTFQFDFFHDHELLATCWITYVCVGLKGGKFTGKSTKIPDDIVEH